MRRLAALLVSVAALMVAPPVSADMPNSGLHLEHGAKNAAGCYSLELWNADTLITTFAARTPPHPELGETCAFTDYSTLLPNGRFVFTWRYWSVSQDPDFDTEYIQLWASNGTVDGTERIPTCGGHLTFEVVDQTLFVSEQFCQTQSVIKATRGTAASTFKLPGVEAAGVPGGFGTLWLRTGKRIVYDAGLTRHNVNRELYVSDGTRRGSHRLLDIRPGPEGSNPILVSSDGTIATFTANDGQGRATWVTDGTVAGTHKVN